MSFYFGTKASARRRSGLSSLNLLIVEFTLRVVGPVMWKFRHGEERIYKYELAKGDAKRTGSGCLFNPFSNDVSRRVRRVEFIS
jgi:hypothetical protein